MEAKAAEVNLLKLISKGLSEEPLEVMMTKRTRPAQDIEPPLRAHHKRSKGRNKEGPSHQERIKKTRRRIGIKDLMISRGQKEYSIITDLSQQSANITVGQLIAKCPSLRRELRQGISTRRTTSRAAKVRLTEKVTNETRSPQVKASIANRDIHGCLVDGGAAVNVTAKWIVDDLELSPIKHSNLRLKVADQRNIRCLGLLSQIPTTVNEMTVKIDFQILRVSEARRLPHHLGNAMAESS